MTRLLYFDAVGGVAGDMALGALVDAGAGLDDLRDGLAGLPVDGLALRAEPVERAGLGATRVHVSAAPDQPHRHLADVLAIIDAAGLPERAARRARAVFARLADAEAHVHRVGVEDVHFHEVGAADAIADVCGTALALELLGVDELWCSALPVARGVVRGAHGVLPLPAPATLRLLEGAPLHGLDGAGELVTPTGAAIVTALSAGFGPLPAIRLGAVGYGAGAADPVARPNVLRVLVGERVAGGAGLTDVSLIETNLDDLQPELVPDAAAGCFEAGALDVWVTPAQMKKGRPGVVLAALARPAEEAAVVDALLRETSALGVRVTTVRRRELDRRWATVTVDGEPVRVKIGSLDGRRRNVAPEHDDCRAVARRSGRPVKEVWAAALSAGLAQEEAG